VVHLANLGAGKLVDMLSNELVRELTATGDLPVQLPGYAAASYVVYSLDWEPQPTTGPSDTPVIASQTE
jgi:hypothetical protein